MANRIIDLFAGPGGWDEGLAMLGRRDVVGIEWDEDACKTAEKAGHQRILADVTKLDPVTFLPIDEGLIASPPCQGFSLAGRGLGRQDTDAILEAVPLVAAGISPQDAVIRDLADPRSLLVLEPLRWASVLRPRWIACEQVPAVLPLWEACARRLARDQGYYVWTGILDAQDYGVPQVRRRAVMLARRSAPVHEPEPTHLGFPVTMADAIGWGMTDRPYPTIACSRTSGGGPDKEKVGGSGARKSLYAERESGRWVHGGGCCCAMPDFCGIWNRKGVPYVETGVKPLGEKRYDGGIRLSLAEAARLQTFPEHYDWQGIAAKRFQQIGNAVPPLLAKACLAAVGVGLR